MTFAETWTSDDIQQLRDLWPLGIPASEIGRRLNKSKNAVVGKTHRLHLEPRKTSDNFAPFDKGRLVAVQALIEAGYSQMEVEARTGVTPHRIRRARAEGDLPEYTRPRVTLPAPPSLAGMPRPAVTVQKPKTKPSAPAREKPVQQERNTYGRHRRISYKPACVPVPMTAAEAADVAQFLAQRGVTKCPTAAVAATTAVISTADRAAIAEHQVRAEEADIAWMNLMREWATRGGQASGRVRS
jgi:hypothetical protein